jgi:hypothetical protein
MLAMVRGDGISLRAARVSRLRWLNYLKHDIKRDNLMSEEKLLILELHSKSRCYSLVDIRKFLTGSDGEDLHLFAAFISLSLSQIHHSSPILLAQCWSPIPCHAAVLDHHLEWRMEGLWHHWRDQIRPVEDRFSLDPMARTFIRLLPFIFVSPNVPFFSPSPSRPVLLIDSFSWWWCLTIHLEWRDGESTAPPTWPDPVVRRSFIARSHQIRWRGPSFVYCVLFFSHQLLLAVSFSCGGGRPFI